MKVKTLDKMDKSQIEKDAKRILGKFAKALEKVDGDNSEVSINVDREEFERVEGEGEGCEGFKEDFLSNAPNKDKDFIIAERGGWK